MRSLFTALLSFLLAAPAFAAAPTQENANMFAFDKSHTRILFFINHLGFSDTVGEFTDYDGTLTFDETKPEASVLNVTLKPAGIRTPSKALDDHLQNKDFFNVAQFPEVTFKSTSVKTTGKNTGEVTGNLTMLGVTKPVVMRVTFNKGDYHPMTGSYVAGFSGEATLKRSDFGMTNGIPMVGDEVRLLVHTELTNEGRKKPQPPKTN